MKAIDRMLGGGWRTVMDYAGARFFRNVNEPGVYMRMRRRDDGSVETRYAWDGDGRVTHSISEVAAALSEDERAVKHSSFTAGDAPEARDD